LEDDSALLTVCSDDELLGVTDAAADDEEDDTSGATDDDALAGPTLLEAGFTDVAAEEVECAFEERAREDEAGFFADAFEDVNTPTGFIADVRSATKVSTSDVGSCT
jgi:hypothetical protein